MVLVSFKNIHIWPSYGQKTVCMPIFGHTFFGHHSAIFGIIELNFLWGLRGLLSSIRGEKSKLLCLFFTFYFLATFGGKWAWPSCAPLSIWGQPGQIVVPLVGPFWPTTISKSCFWNFQGWTPLKMYNYWMLSEGCTFGIIYFIYWD